MFITTSIAAGFLVYLERKLTQKEQALADKLGASTPVIVKKRPTRQLQK